MLKMLTAIAVPMAVLYGGVGFAGTLPSEPQALAVGVTAGVTAVIIGTILVRR